MKCFNFSIQKIDLVSLIYLFIQAFFIAAWTHGCFLGTVQYCLILWLKLPYLLPLRILLVPPYLWQPIIMDLVDKYGLVLLASVLFYFLKSLSCFVRCSSLNFCISYPVMSVLQSATSPSPSSINLATKIWAWDMEQKEIWILDRYRHHKQIWVSSL